MKKIFIFCLMSVILFSGISGYAKAEPIQSSDNPIIISEEVEVLPNGLTITTTLYDEGVVSSDVTPFADSYTTSKTKKQTVQNGSNILFTFSLTGKFTVNPGVSATCTSSSYSHTISHDSWSLDSASASKTGATAKATGIFKKRLLFIVVETYESNLTITCDKNGNFS